MNSFLLAIQFLTSIPIRTKTAIEESELSKAIVYFPAVGLLLGLVLVVMNLILSYFVAYPLLINSMLVISLIILTGALHLDGLADTTDALASGKGKEGILEIMRDPHIGTMGVLSLISVIILKIAILSSLSPNAKDVALIFMCVLSRWSLILPLYLFKYARSQGKAKGFFGALSARDLVFSSLAVLLLVSFIWNWKGLLVFTSSLISAYFFNGYVNKRAGGITGDTLGASLELNEVFVLFFCLIAAKI